MSGFYLGLIIGAPIGSTITVIVVGICQMAGRRDLYEQ